MGALYNVLILRCLIGFVTLGFECVGLGFGGAGWRYECGSAFGMYGWIRVYVLSGWEKVDGPEHELFTCMCRDFG